MSSRKSSQQPDGFTSLLGQGSVAKNHPRIETLGALDEASAAMGLARSLSQSQVTRTLIHTLQHDLYLIMAEVAATPEHSTKFQRIDTKKITWLEEQVSLESQKVTPPKGFIIPGENLPGAALAMARTVVRRAERNLTGLFLAGEINNNHLLKYLNLLSTLCFYLELQTLSQMGESSLNKEKS